MIVILSVSGFHRQNFKLHSKFMIVGFLVCSLFGCAPSVERNSSSFTTDEILSEDSIDLSHDFRLVSREQVNKREHWEAVGHFDFLYYKDKRICQCGENDFVISPSGAYAIYVDEKNGQLNLYFALTNERRVVSSTYIGAPLKADWDVENNRVTIQLRKYEKGVAIDTFMDSEIY